MFVHSSTLNGPRRHRISVGVLLAAFGLLFGTVLASYAYDAFQDGATDSLLAFGGVALSVWGVAWWSTRFAYAAFREGRSAEPPAQPEPWPWAGPPLALGTIMVVNGVTHLRDGKSDGWFFLGFAALLLVPLVAALVVLVLVARSRRRPPAPAAPEPPRPRRDWGSIGR